MRAFLRQLKEPRVSESDITECTRHLAELLGARVGIRDALHLIATSAGNYRTSNIAAALLAQLHQGNSFTAAVQNHNRWFNPLYCQLVAIGEVSGTLPLLLRQLMVYRIGAQQVSQKIRRATTYPLLVLTTAVLMMMGLLAFVIPRFRALFGADEDRLPLLTRVVIGLSGWVQSNGLLLAISLAAVVLLGILAWRRQSLRTPLLRVLLRVPIIGTIMRLRQREILLRSFALMIEVKLPIIKTLEQLIATATPLVQPGLTRMADSLYQGQGLDIAMQQSRLFAESDSYAARLGQQSANLDRLLLQQANQYATLLEQKLHRLVMLLEPAMMLGIGAVIALLILAVYLPLFSIGAAL